MKTSSLLRITMFQVIFSSFFLAAASQDMTMDDLKLVQQAFGREKKVLMGDCLKMDDAQSAKFWPIYDKYEEERRKLGQERFLIIDDYAKNYDKLTNEKADQLINRVLKNDEGYSKLQKKYYEQIKKATSALTAAKFLQLENYIQTSIRSEVQEEIPFIGELEKQKPKN